MSIPTDLSAAPASALRCPLCRGPLPQADLALLCEACGTKAHLRCVRELNAGACPTYGCGEQLGFGAVELELPWRPKPLRPRKVPAGTNGSERRQAREEEQQGLGTFRRAAAIVITWILAWPLTLFVGPFALVLALPVALWLWRRKLRKTAAGVLLLSPVSLVVVLSYVGGLSDYAAGEARIDDFGHGCRPDRVTRFDREVGCRIRLHAGCASPVGLPATIAIGNNLAVRHATRLFGRPTNAYPHPIPTVGEAGRLVAAEGSTPSRAEVEELLRHVQGADRYPTDPKRWRACRVSPRARLFRHGAESPILFDDVYGVIELD